MARPAKVWYRGDIGWWIVTLGGEKTRLLKGPNDEQYRQLAEEKFVELRKIRRIAPQAPTSRTADIIEAYLAWSRQNLSTETHRVNQYYCQLFAEHCGTVPARDLKPFHITAWIAAMRDPKRVEQEIERRKSEIQVGNIEKRYQGRPPKVWGESTAHNARVAAFRVFSWAKDEGLLTENPLVGLKRPKPPSRQRAMSEDEFTKLHRDRTDRRPGPGPARCDPAWPNRGPIDQGQSRVRQGQVFTDALGSHRPSRVATVRTNEFDQGR